MSCSAHHLSNTVVLHKTASMYVDVWYEVVSRLVSCLQEAAEGRRTALAQQADAHDDELVASHAVMLQWQRYAEELAAQLPADDAAGGEPQGLVSDSLRDAGGSGLEACSVVATEQVLTLSGVPRSWHTHAYPQPNRLLFHALSGRCDLLCDARCVATCVGLADGSAQMPSVGTDCLTVSITRALMLSLSVHLHTRFQLMTGC